MQVIRNDGSEFNIQPSDIDTSKHFHNSFGKHETEISARWIVRACQRQGSWAPFTRAFLDEVYTPADGFWFNGLDGRGYIVIEDDRIYVTEEFIRLCYKSSPARKV